MKITWRHIRHLPYHINFRAHKHLGIRYDKKSKKYADLSMRASQIAHALYEKHHNISVPPVKDTQLSEAAQNEIVESQGSCYSELLAGNTRFKDIHKGKRCFILGNGPSLRDQDLSLLADEITFTVNKITYMEGFESIKSNYHFWADPSFFESIVDEQAFAESIAMMKKVALFREDIECFAPAWFYENTIKMGLDKSLNMNYFDATGPEMPPVHVDFTNRISWVCTVIHAAIYLAIYMGFSEIYLLGCESTGIIPTVNAWLNADITGYAYTVSKNDKELFYSLKKVYKMEDEFHGFYLIFKNYRIIGDYCKENGIYLCNCTPGGILDVLPRERYEDVIQKEKATEKRGDVI